MPPTIAMSDTKPNIINAPILLSFLFFIPYEPKPDTECY